MQCRCIRRHMHFWGWVGPPISGRVASLFCPGPNSNCTVTRRNCLFPVIFSYIPFGITASPTSSLKVSESWREELIEGCSLLGCRLILRPLRSNERTNKDSSTTEGGGGLKENYDIRHDATAKLECDFD